MASSIKAAVHGAYFYDNFGDTLLIRLMCDWLAERIGRENVFLAIPAYAFEQETIGYPVIPEQERRSITHLVYTGGGHFGETKLSLMDNYRWQRGNRQRHLEWLGSYSHAKKALFGLGVGPISNPFYRREIRRLFLQADIIYVRDAESLYYAKKYRFNPKRVHLGTDLVMSIGPATKLPKKSFALHLLQSSPAEMAAVTDALLLQGLVSGTVDIILDERESSKGTIDHYQNTIGARFGHDRLRFIGYGGVDAMISLLSDYELLFTSKLHVGIAATALGRKVIALPHHRKTIRFYRQLGLEYFCLDKRRRNAGEISKAIASNGNYAFDRTAIAGMIQAVHSSLDAFIFSGETPKASRA